MSNGEWPRFRLKRQPRGKGKRYNHLPEKFIVLFPKVVSMFADRVILYCRGGDGGNGCSSFRREVFVPRGGPDGGDGGNGGDIILKADTNQGSLGNLVGHRHWNAERGEHGLGALCAGKRGKTTTILVPPGTLIKDLKHGHVLKDLQNHGDSVILCHGGRGGRGNTRFATPTNRAPRESEAGHPGEYREVGPNLHSGASSPC